MELCSYLALGIGRWRWSPDDIVNGAIPGLGVVGIGVQVLLCIRWRRHEL